MSVASKRQQRSKFIKPSSLLHFCITSKRGFSTDDISWSWSLSMRDTCAKILRIKWQDMIPNTEVLRRARSTSIDVLLIKAQLRWTGHILRMEDGRLPKELLYEELREGSRHVGGQRKRFKDTLKRSLTVCNIDIDKWESTAQDRMQGEDPCKAQSTLSKTSASPLPRKNG